MDIVGFGTGGSKIARCFQKYDKYTVHTIDYTGADYIYPRCNTIEEAEERAPDLFKLKEKVGDEVLFVCCGGGVISGGLLATLQQFGGKKIKFLYVRPDMSFLNAQAKLRERMVFGVMQEYARSGVIDHIYLFSNADMAQVIDGLSIIEYYPTLNQTIVDVYNLTRYYKEASPIMSNGNDLLEVCKITAFGLYEFGTEKENKFFKIESVRQKHFYFTLNKNTLQEGKNMVSLIGSKLEKAIEHDYMSISYSIFDSGHEEDRVYVAYHTNAIQK